MAEVHHIDAAGLPRESEHSVIREFRIPGLTVLGRDENDTISALRSIDSGRGSVLEDFHRDDIGRVDSGERGDRGDLTVTKCSQTEVPTGVTATLNDHTVDDVKRLSVGVDSSLSTDADRR